MKLLLNLSILVCCSTCLSLADVDMPCKARDYGHGTVVCVCNATYCDTISATRPVPFQSASIYTSTKAGLRFSFSVQALEKSQNSKSNPTVISIDARTNYQKIKGFGGAVTDAAAFNIKSLSSSAQERLLQSYFSQTGIEYNLARVPIASCDYSKREYTYLDKENDFNLTSFSLAVEDTEYKIPILQYILNITAKPVSLYASPWTAPAWMKTNNDEIGRGWLKGKAGDAYHKTWARYFTKFFDEYKKHGINFWGVTAQNEPSNGLLVKSTWQSTGFTAQTQRDFIKTDLGPALHRDGYENVKLMILDDQRVFLPLFPEVVLSDKEAAQYVSGVGVHWYWNSIAGPALLTDTHNKFPETFILATEACNKDSPEPDLGNWEYGQKYSNDILDNLNHWSIGWVDWNMCLDLNGGPNWAKNFDDSPIIVNKTADEFYKQPMYFHMGHFSKFLPEDSVVIKSSINTQSSQLKFVAATTPSNQTVLVILNPSSNRIPITIDAPPYTFNYTMNADAIETFVWN